MGQSGILGAKRSAPLTGKLLGRYEIGERLGAGGAASVYLARLRGPHDWERVLALKVVHEHPIVSSSVTATTALPSIASSRSNRR
jgi:hypothetical protein